jgi:hypothetical protein
MLICDLKTHVNELQIPIFSQKSYNQFLKSINHVLSSKEKCVLICGNVLNYKILLQKYIFFLKYKTLYKFLDF